MAESRDEKLDMMRRLAEMQAEMSELRDWMADQSAEAALHGRYAPRDVWLASQKRLRELGREHQALQIQIAALNRKRRADQQVQEESEKSAYREQRRVFDEIMREFVGTETYESLWAEARRRANRTGDALSALPPESAPPGMRSRDR